MTIWSLLEQCVRQLDEPFRRSEIIGWFRRHHPEVLESSLAAHIQGATAGAPGRGPFASRKPLLVRVDCGLYRRAEHSKQPTVAASPTRERAAEWIACTHLTNGLPALSQAVNVY